MEEFPEVSSPVSNFDVPKHGRRMLPARVSWGLFAVAAGLGLLLLGCAAAKQPSDLSDQMATFPVNEVPRYLDSLYHGTAVCVAAGLLALLYGGALLYLYSARCTLAHPQWSYTAHLCGCILLTTLCTVGFAYMMDYSSEFSQFSGGCTDPQNRHCHSTTGTDTAIIFFSCLSFLLWFLVGLDFAWGIFVRIIFKEEDSDYVVVAQ